MTTQNISELLSTALSPVRVRDHEPVSLGNETYEAESYLLEGEARVNDALRSLCMPRGEPHYGVNVNLACR